MLNVVMHLYKLDVKNLELSILVSLGVFLYKILTDISSQPSIYMTDSIDKTIIGL